jgi:predicted DNA-binding transcriptional regulator AlpA
MKMTTAVSVAGMKEKHMKEEAQKPTDADPLLTLMEVGAILKAGRTKVWRCCNEPDEGKRLRTIKIGGLVRVRQSDLQDFINRHRN